MTTNIHIDLETYSEADLPKVGLYRYATDPSSEILMMAWAFDDEEVKVSDNISEIFQLVTEDPDSDFSDYLIWAHNAAFERIMLREVLGIDIPIERWRCTQVLGYSFAFSGGLGDMVKALDAPEEMQKDTVGTRLIRRFSKPQPKNHKVRRWTKENDPEGWAQFKEYCRQDVVAERWLHSRLDAYGMPEWLWDEYALDQKINDEGVPLDVPFVNAAIKAAKEEKKVLLAQMNKITGLSNSGSGQQLHGWLKEHDITLPDLTKDTVAATLKEGTGVAAVDEVLKIKQKHSKTSVTKFNAMARAVCADGKLHGMFQFGGAARTLRWAGRIVQLQNLARPTISDPDSAAELILSYGAEGVRMFWDVMDSLSSTVRSALMAEDGDLLMSPDLSSIESRLVGWITGCKAINDTFAAGLDTYKIFATRAYGVSYDAVTLKQRKQSKPPVLGGPYGLGAKGLVAYAEGMHIEMTEEEAQGHTDTLRSEWHEIPTFWRWIMKAVFLCTQTGIETKGYCVRVYAQGEFLRIELPSGRSLSYHKPKIIKKKAPWGDIIDNFSFMGNLKGTKKWARITAHGGFLLENITQAIARDILAIWMGLCDAEGVKIVGHVHDEIIAAAPRNEAAGIMDRMIELSRVPIPWAPGLILNADGEGFPAKRFRK